MEQLNLTINKVYMFGAELFFVDYYSAFRCESEVTKAISKSLNNLYNTIIQHHLVFLINFRIT